MQTKHIIILMAALCLGVAYLLVLIDVPPLASLTIASGAFFVSLAINYPLLQINDEHDNDKPELTNKVVCEASVKCTKIKNEIKGLKFQ